MEKLRKNIIIISSLAFLLVSFTFLAKRESDEQNPSKGKDWWSVSFVEPTSPSNLDFSIENHGEDGVFIYEYLADEKVARTNSVIIPNGSVRTVSDGIRRTGNERIRINVRKENGQSKDLRKK